MGDSQTRGNGGYTQYGDPKKRRLKAQIIGAAIATLAGVLMFLIGFFLFTDHISFRSAKVAICPLPLSLAVFPFAGLTLSDIGIRLNNSEAPFILIMSIASVVTLFITAAAWFQLYSVMIILFFGL